MSGYWDWKSRFGRYKEDRRFLERVPSNLDPRPHEQGLNYNHFVNRHTDLGIRDPVRIFNDFFRLTREAIATGGRLESFYLDRDVHEDIPVEPITIAGQGDPKGTIGTVVIQQGWGQREVSFENLVIETLAIYGPANAHFNNCEVGNLIFSGNAAHKDVFLKNCRIGRAHFMPSSCDVLEFQDCTILGVKCRPPSAGNPFTGNVIFQNTRLSLDPTLMVNVQHYRNVRHHLFELQNLEAAGVFQKVVLVCERRASNSKFLKFASAIYEKFSDFGNSVTRPIAWWFGGVVATCLGIYLFDGAVTPHLSPESVTDWRTLLLLEGWAGQFWRSFILTLDAWAGPIGILYDHNLVTSRTWGIGIWMVLSRIIATILLTLLILALRRKFRMG